MSGSAFRLPRTVLPEHYDLRLAPDLMTNRFNGVVDISIGVLRDTDEIVLHAAGLDITKAWIVLPADPGTRQAQMGLPKLREGIPSLDVHDETLTLRFAETVPAGPTRLHIEFDGVLHDDLRGLYRSTFTDDTGATHTIAVTQFEATDARRAFPCFDEPDHKATFGITVDVAESLLAVSNSPELERTPLDDGLVRIRFADTMKMSTYLVALVVGPLETSRTVDVDGVPLRIVFSPGDAALAEFALDVGAFALRYFAEYYGIDYPGTKLDMVAVPDFAFGAMENLGCVIYRENLLLIDPERATHGELQAVVDVVAHELAHMWFGDLVTMKWWNGIWLNEAFATTMEMKCADAYKPEWERWMLFARERTGAFDVDATASTRAVEFPVESPAEADAMFDVLTYQKGSAVVRMLEQYLGEDAFRDGIRRYLQTHQFGNTDTTDLWDAIEAETGEPVRALMDSWIFQPGFPLLFVSEVDDGVRISQQRYTFDGSTAAGLWQVPITMRDRSDRSTQIVLDADDTVVGTQQLPVVVNSGGWGFYRTAYQGSLRDGVVEQLSSLEPLERYVVVDDAWALVERGSLPATIVTDMIERLAAAGERSSRVWELCLHIGTSLGRAVEPQFLPVVDSWTVRTLGPVLDAVGFDTDPDDSALVRDLRGSLVEAIGGAGDERVLALASDVLQRSDAEPDQVDAGLVLGSIRAVATHADLAGIESFIDRIESAATPQEALRYLYGIALVRDDAAFERVLDYYGSPAVRSQNLTRAVRAALTNTVNGHRGWRMLRENWASISARVPGLAAHRLLEGIGTFGDATLAADVESFVAEHKIEGAERSIAQHIDRMHRMVSLRGHESERLSSALQR